MQPKGFPSDPTCTWSSSFTTSQRKHIHLFPLESKGVWIQPQPSQGSMVLCDILLDLLLAWVLCVTTHADQSFLVLILLCLEPSDLVIIFYVHYFQFICIERTGWWADTSIFMCYHRGKRRVMSCSDKTNFKCKSSEVRRSWLFHGTPSASEVTSESQAWGVEEEGRVQAIKGPGCHTGKFQLFFLLGQWRAIAEL